MKKILTDIYIYIYKYKEKRRFQFTRNLQKRMWGERYLISHHSGDVYA